MDGNKCEKNRWCVNKKECMTFYGNNLNYVTCQGESLPRLSANGLFHWLFGWNSALRIIFFIRNDSKLAFLEKNPLKHALFICKTTQTADNNKVLLSFYEQNQTTIITLFYPKRFVKQTVCRRPRKTMVSAGVKTWFNLIFKIIHIWPSSWYCSQVSY